MSSKLAVPSLGDAIGGNPYAELIRRARTTPHMVVLENIHRGEKQLGEKPASELAQEIYYYLLFLEVKFDRQATEARREKNDTDRQAIVDQLRENYLEYTTLSGILQFMFMAEFPGVDTARVELRKGGFAVMTRKNRAECDVFTRDVIEALERGKFVRPLSSIVLLRGDDLFENP